MITKKKSPLLLCLFIITFFLFSTIANANTKEGWLQIYSDDNRTTYIELTTIEKLDHYYGKNIDNNNILLKVWISEVYSNPTHSEFTKEYGYPKPIAERLDLRILDFKNKQSHFLKTINYDENGNALRSYTYSSIDPPIPVVPESIVEIVFDEIFSYYINNILSKEDQTNQTKIHLKPVTMQKQQI